MSETAPHDLAKLEDTLWADASNRYDAAMAQIAADQAAGKTPERALVKGDLIKRLALMLPKE